MIEELKNNDINTLENIFKEIFSKSNIITTKNSNPFTNFFVLKRENEIIGFINFDLIYDRAELININIIDKYKGNGYGKMLLQFMIEDVKKKAKNITLEVRKDNIIAINLYKSNGFKEKAIRKNYYGSVDAILMERE